MDMIGEKVEEVVKPEFIESYENLFHDLLSRMVHASDNMIILEKIEEFYLHSPNDDVFWFWTYLNYVYATVLLLHGLTQDSGKDVHTLKTFKKKLTEEWMQDSKQDYKDKLKKTDFDNKLKEIHKKIDRLRDCRIAHRLLEDRSNKLKDICDISVSELRKVYEDSKRLFNSCCIGCDCQMSLYEEDGPERKPKTEDIDHIFELIIKKSDWFTLPEKPNWNQIKPIMLKEVLENINYWRKKFGMPEI